LVWERRLTGSSGLGWLKRRDLLGLMEAALWMQSKGKQREGKETARN